MTVDKRVQCGCHRECTWLSHACEKPCIWPNCLTDDEQQQLLDEVEAMLYGFDHAPVVIETVDPVAPYTLHCKQCGLAEPHRDKRAARHRLHEHRETGQ